MSELKAILVFFGLLALGMILWDVIGLDSGTGGTPYELYEESYLTE